MESFRQEMVVVYIAVVAVEVASGQILDGGHLFN